MCLILYGSETGNCADLADALLDQLRRRRLRAVCKPFGESSLAEVLDHGHVFVLCATTGQGQLPPSAQPFWRELLRRSLKAPVLAPVSLYAFGLGSTAYPKYNWAIRKIHARLLQLGAKEAVPRGEGNDMGEPYEYVFDQWLALALSHLDSQLQVTDVAAGLLPPIRPVRVEAPGVGDSLGMLSLEADPEANATIVTNQRITAQEHFQDVRHIAIALDTPTVYEPGDVVRLYPDNDAATVDAVLASQAWPATAQTNLGCTVRDALLKHVDLNAIPRRKFFVLCQHFCAKPAQRERMEEFSADLDDLFNYTTRPRRSIAEVVLEFDSLRIPLEYLLDAFPPLRPRQFSIASKPDSAAPQPTVELCVAIVKYRTALRRIRRGLCTRWLDQHCPPGTRVRVAFEANAMQLARRAAGRPVILVAAGTGIAPIRSWMRNASSEPWLVFGCRNERDFLYRNEFGNARVIPAFSQPLDGSPKTYVQHAISQHPELPVKDALIFVCGSSGPMPTGVRDAFVELLTAQGLDGEQIIQQKEKSGLYFQETW